MRWNDGGERKSLLKDKDKSIIYKKEWAAHNWQQKHSTNKKALQSWIDTNMQSIQADDGIKRGVKDLIMAIYNFVYNNINVWILITCWQPCASLCCDGKLQCNRLLLSLSIIFSHDIVTATHGSIRSFQTYLQAQELSLCLSFMVTGQHS